MLNQELWDELTLKKDGPVYFRGLTSSKRRTSICSFCDTFSLFIIYHAPRLDPSNRKVVGSCCHDCKVTIKEMRVKLPVTVTSPRPKYDAPGVNPYHPDSATSKGRRRGIVMNNESRNG